MITLVDIKNFFQRYWDYILLGIFGFGLLGVGVYYLAVDNWPVVVVDRRSNQINKKGYSKKKVNLDPVIDNIYWLIVSFVVYYSVYLGLKYSGYKDYIFWVILSLVVLGKIGLAAFSSFYYQKNNFDQNLNKSFNPNYFVNQDITRIILALVGYLSLATLVYFDSKKTEPEQGYQNLLNQNNQNLLEEEKKEENKEKEKIKNFDSNALNNFFQQTFNLFLVKEPSKGLIELLKKEGDFDFNQIIKPIKQGIQAKQISAKGVSDLISDVIMFERYKDDDYYKRENYKKKPLINCFFYCLEFFFYKEKGCGQFKEMASIFLKKLINSPDDYTINSLKELINEFFYFANCVKNFASRFIDVKRDKKDYKYVILYEKSFATVIKTQQSHLKFLQDLVKHNGLQNFFQRETKMKLDECQNVEVFYYFFEKNKNKIAVSRNIFLASLVFENNG